MMFQISLRTTEGLPSAISLASIFIRLTCVEIISIITFERKDAHDMWRET